MLCCSRTRTPVDPRGQAGAETKSQPPAVPSAAASQATLQLPPALPDGCYNGVDADLPARAKLAALAERCVFGMTPILPQPARLVLVKGGQHQLKFTVRDPSRCLRAAAAANRSVGELELAIEDDRGRVVAKDELPGSFALVTARGPVCAERASVHRAVVRAPSGAGEVAVQLWQAK